MTSEDMPWVLGLTDEEVQELRSKKQELTQYGKEKLRKLMTEKLSFENFTKKINIRLDQKFLEDLNMTEEEVRNDILQSAYQDYLNKNG